MLTIYGIIPILNYIVVTVEIVLDLIKQIRNKMFEINYRITILRCVSKYTFRTAFYNGEKDCIICWEVFEDD